MVQEACDGPGKVVGQVGTLHPGAQVAEDLGGGGPAGGGHVGEQQAAVGMGIEQRMHQGCAGPGFPHRHGMEPDEGADHGRRIAPKALPHVLQVFRLAARTPSQAQTNQRYGQVPECGVKETEYQRGAPGACRSLKV